jgi:integrase/recombinase XerD
MTPLRQRMIEDMQLRGLSARTQEAYARAVWQLAQHYQRSPNKLGDEELRQYFLYLTNQKKIARPTATIALCGIKFFYEQTLKQPWPTLRFVRPPREWKLPVVLSRKEVLLILGEVRIPVYRACLATIYSCGLRLLEGSRLQVADVHSARMLLHIHGKSKKDRYVPLPAPTLKLLSLTGARITHPCGCFPHPRATDWPIAWRTMVARSRAAVCRVLSARRSNAAVSPNGRTCIR